MDLQQRNPVFRDPYGASKAAGQLSIDSSKREAKSRRTLEEMQKNAVAMGAAKQKLIAKVLDLRGKDRALVKYNERIPRAAEAVAKKLQTDARAGLLGGIDPDDDPVPDQTHMKFGLEGGAGGGDHLQEPAPGGRSGSTESQIQEDLRGILLASRSTRNPAKTLLFPVTKAVTEVLRSRQYEKHSDEVRARVHAAATDRNVRVRKAAEVLKGKLGSLDSLIHCRPVEYRSGVGVREAQLRELRTHLQKLQTEETKLSEERRIQVGLIESDQAELTEDVEECTGRLAAIEHELETKEEDVATMIDDQAPTTGTWAGRTSTMEEQTANAIDEEQALMAELESVKNDNAALAAEKRALDAEIADNVAELTSSQLELQGVADKIHDRLAAEKARLYELREKETDTTREINLLRHRILHRREDVRRQKRQLRGRINATISELAIEDREQSRLMAKSLEMQKGAEKARAQADHHLVSLENQLKRVSAEVSSKMGTINSYAEQLANYYAGKGDVVPKDINLTPTQLQTKIDQLSKEWARIEWEAASSVAQVASRVDINYRENERTLRAMGKYAILQEDVAGESINITTVTDEQLEHVREQMREDLTQRNYREAKYNQMIRMMQQRLKMRGKGAEIVPLSRNRRVSLEQRRARRRMIERSNQSRQVALDHLKEHSFAQKSALELAAQGGLKGAGRTAPIGAGNPTAHRAEFRMMLINFIKKEIQPLYDAHLLNKRRFVDLVARVSSWYLETHPPSRELTETDVQNLSRKIQETINKQDELEREARVEAEKVADATQEMLDVL